MDVIENQAQVEFEYKIDPQEDPSIGNVTSNITSTNQVIGSLNMVKSVDKEYATIGDILNYTVVLSNIGNILVTDIVFTDILPEEVTFVEGSVYVDSQNEPTYDPNDGFNVGSLLILGSKTITFKAEVISLPDPNTIKNKASTSFYYLVVLPVQGNALSNEATTIINVSDIAVVKSASVEYVESGDMLSYTIVITNEGNIDATDVFFTDTVASELTFVTSSVKIDEVEQITYDPNVGFSLGIIAPGDSVTVTFKTTVN